MIVIFLGVLGYFQTKGGDNFLYFLFVFWLNILKDIPYRLKYQINAYRPVILVSGLLWKLFSFGVEIVITPKKLGDILRFFIELFGNKRGKTVSGESPVVKGRTKNDVSFLSGEEKLVLKLFELFSVLYFLVFVVSLLRNEFLRYERTQYGVNLLNDLVDMCVCLHGVHLAMNYQLVDFVKYQNAR